MVDNDRDGEPPRGYFEFFKHLSTLSTLVLVVVLVLYRSFSGTPPRRLLYVAVGGLVGAVLCLIAGIATAGVF
jgi:hypothetical protein